ncbi:MAG: chemotaxis protein CheR [Blastomonas sp. CACIA14H2]|jgi:chemotaxis protein methyltransferase CheR|uniref:CheR family methyltransferase n=1 Tax=unclassified Blastomonas TaxID=2626550 RepID=UPI0003CF9FA0|nr:protein-glutamate O-methyltransferase CheR [Blastomonas sp. UPD001]ESZ88619.1 MAG: chemotaxis protein CheR [Blastomonas sp. CACIA14H2]MBL0967398.1 protein-glutamate O-methyltransferase CheR [Blastomonas sp.]
MIHSQPAADATRILAGLLETRTGQQIAPSRYWRIQTALAPLLKQNGIPDLDALVAVLSDPDNERLLQECLELMLNNESFFFRDIALFATLRSEALPQLRERRAARKSLRIWCAGCSTGQEAYSVAMLIDSDRDLWEGWTIEIIGTDISASVIAKARSGRYTQFEIQRGLSVDYMLRYFTQDGEDWVIDPRLQQIVRFQEENILKPRTEKGQFDIILCRNVLMYFAPETRSIAYAKLEQALQDDGLLMLGAAETVMDQTTLFSTAREMRGLHCKAVPGRTGASVLPPPLA